ncbi:gliding motility lipoprotein GldD [Flavitalea antarctica]
MRSIFIILLIALISCNSDYTLKQRGYYKIDFPEHQYTLYAPPGSPYSFEYPVYAKIVRDSTFFEAKPENDYWINIDFPQFYGKIYISYKEIKKNNFDSLVADAFKMTYKHTSKATEIRDSLMKTPAGHTGVFFQVGGNAATAKQFFVTDSVKHFIRGALYFDASPNADSLGVVNNFLEQDMKHLINTLRLN